MTILSRSFFFLKVPAIRFRSLEQRRRRRRATRASPPSRRADSHFRRSLCWARKETATRQSISRIIGQPLHPFLPLQQLARARSSSGDPETILPFYPLRFNPSFRLLPTIETRNNARDLVASRFSSTRILPLLLLRWKSARKSIENTDQTRAKIGDDSPLGQPHVERTCVLRAWVVAYY